MQGEPIAATGIISGFGSISFTQSNTTEQITPSNFSLADVKRYLEEIRDCYSPTALNDLVLQILGHTQDFNNPHHVTLSQLGVDIVNSIYLAWLQAGNTGSEATFLETIFQVVPIASDADFAGGTSTNLVNVKQVVGAIAAHNTDPNAHTDLINAIMPGTPPLANPSYGFDARVGIPLNATVVNSTGLTLLDRNGNLTTVPANTLGIDYSTGGPTFPLYGPRTNTIHPSSPLSTPGGVVGSTMSTATAGSPVGTLQVGPDKASVAALTETTAASIHGYQTSIALTSGSEYTSSCFIYPLNTTKNIVVYIASQPTTAILLNPQTMALITQSGSVIGYAQKLRNGWIRIGIQYLAASTTTTNLVIATTTATTLSGTYTYTGTSALMFGIFGLQHVNGAGMSPYIPTTTAAASHDNTVLTVTASFANLVQGIVSMRYNVPNSLVSTNRLYATVGPSLGLIIQQANSSVRVVPRLNGTIGTIINLAEEFNQLVTTACSFDTSGIKFITTGSAKSPSAGQLLSLGSSNSVSVIFGDATNTFNGALRAFSVYPVSDTNLELEFLVGQILS